MPKIMGILIEGRSKDTDSLQAGFNAVGFDVDTAEDAEVSDLAVAAVYPRTGWMFSMPAAPPCCEYRAANTDVPPCRRQLRAGYNVGSPGRLTLTRCPRGR